jgi:hypothetical protein
MRFFATVLGGVLLALSTDPGAQALTEIVVWTVGSPHRGDIPPTRPIPIDLQAATARFGARLRVEAFPPAGFDSVFRQAASTGTAPDLIAFDNFGIMEGITTSLGRFEGIAVDPADKADFIHVTTAFDSLLGPARGWVYAYKKSLNHAVAKKLALRPPECSRQDAWPITEKALGDIVSAAAVAYMEGKADNLRLVADRERLETKVSTDRVSWRQEAARVSTIQLCGLRGTDHLAFAWATVSSEAPSKLGHTPIVVILRKAASNWRVLVVSRDPITTGRFVDDLRARRTLFSEVARGGAPPLPAVLLSPAMMLDPTPVPGERFGDFTWQSSQSLDVAAEIVEFAYENDARIFLTDPARTVSDQRISSGSLWTTRSVWQWRVWSVTNAGDVAFSESRPFPH